MRTFATVLPWFLPGVALSIVVALLLGRRIADRLKTTWPVAALLIVALGAVLAATIPPDRGLLGAGARAVCDLARLGPAPIGEYLRLGDTSLNVALFVPLGLALGLLPRASAKRLWPLAILLPFAIEALQLLVPALGRGCQSADVFDNLLGLALGASVAGVINLFYIRTLSPLR